MTQKLGKLKHEKEKKNAAEKTTSHERGCIIKLALNATNDEHFKLLKMTRQQFKDAMLKDCLDSIAYVDVEKNSNRVLIRCKSADRALELVRDEKFMCGFEKSRLDGKEEDEYLEKIEASRSKKMEKKVKKMSKSEPSDYDKKHV